ncbi:putative transcription factor & chromatin remodeling CW-Zn family [Helianthus annuus]|nr:putative transcription factor & chromatin remodeling CW-Zn family [Helianthus annuus]
MVNETELEEGEARFDDNDACFDPDTALSYIDKRLQHVLGHFQKDFEQEMSAELLGPKYGGYGSFLPTHKHPLAIPSHTNTLNSNKPSSPKTFHMEAAPAPLNPVALVDPVKPAALHHKDVRVDQNAPSVDDVASKGTSLSRGETFLSKNETPAGGLVNPTGQRSLKVRIKVGSYKPAIKNDEIYSGLGLLTPSSSMSNNTDDSSDNDPPIESHDPPFDSPRSILRDMSSIFVPGSRLLSPLNESLLCLKNKVTPLFMGRQMSFSVVDDSSSVREEVKQMEPESVDCKQGLTSDIKVKPSSDYITSETNRAAKKDVPLKIRETKKEMMKDQLFGNDFTSNESAESYEQKKVKKLSLDSKGVRLIVCENEPDVIKHETDRFEKKVGLKAINCEPQEAKSSNNMAKLQFERKNKLSGIHKKENLRSSLSGVMKDKKTALRDIVEVRNSYKDLFDTDNGAIKVENTAGNAIPADVAATQQIVVGPAAPPDNWVGCDRCEKWRLLPIGIEPHNLPDKWLCSMSTWLPGRNRCDIGEDETTRGVQELNLQFISQSQGILQCNDSMVNIRNSERKNSNIHSETMANKFEKSKSRPPEGTSTSLIEASHSSMDALQLDRQKRKGDARLKKLKSKTGSEQYETVTSIKIKTESEQLNYSNGSHRPTDRLVVSVKTRTESNILDKEVEIHAKKRKLKDWQESQPHANVSENSENRIKRKEKRLKTEVKESSDDICLNKGKTMKIKLPASKENSVDTNHVKNQQHRSKTTCKKDSGSERFSLAANSSSSIVSGSCKRASLQERIESPAGAVLSSPISSFNVGKTISRKAHVRTEIPRKDIDASQSQRIGGKADLKHKEASKIRNSHNLEHTTNANGAIDKYERSNVQRVKIKASDPLTSQPNKMRRVEANLGDMGSPEMNPTVKRKSKKVSLGDISKIRDASDVEPKVEVQALDYTGQNRSKVMKHPGVAANPNHTSLVTDCGNLSVTSFLKEFASSQSQTALTAFKRAEESKDHADRLKISGFDYECNNAYFDSALKFLCAASLLEACNADISKSKGVDTINVYTTSAKLFKICAEEYEKRKELVASTLAYKCMEVSCMRIVYCKNLLTRQDLQTSESPSSSASDVDNLNNQATMDKPVLSKSIAHHKNHLIVRNQANFTRLLDLASDVNLAMEASTKAQNAYKSASAVIEEAQNKEMTISVKRVVNFSFQDVKEFACLVQKAREAVNRQGNKRQGS